MRKGLNAPGVNSLQTDQLFAELFATLAAPAGRVGCIIPTAIATGAGGQYLFGDLRQAGRRRITVRLREQEATLSCCGLPLQVLPAVADRQGGARACRPVRVLPLDVADLDDPGRVFALSPEELALINPNTGTLPIFRNRRDAALTAEIYQRIPVLWDETKRDGNPWGITFKNLFNMTDDSDLFRTREQLEREGWRLDGNVFTRDGEAHAPAVRGEDGRLLQPSCGRRGEERNSGQPAEPAELSQHCRTARPRTIGAAAELDHGRWPDSNPQERQGRQGSWRR